ncbi:ankyrin repeat-containing domain protein [Nemania sp. FL0031]|nr:ankyrin repeat-containing domain protein [Nemania sp. FL0031]
MSDGHTTLTYVVCQAGDSRRHADVVKKLLDTGIDPNARSAHKLSALHWAAGKGNFEVTSALLQRGADARATGPDGSSTLHYLARHTVAKTNIAQALIEAGSDPMKPDEHGRLPLHIASEAGDIKLMEFMIERNPSSINTLGTDHRTTLHFGIKSTESIDWLLDRGLNIDAKDKKGKTALMLAVESGIVSSISALLKRDANVRITRKDGSTVLHVAVHHDNLDIGRELLKWHPTILSCRDRENASALHDAISWGKSKFALMLLDEHYAKIIEDSPGRIRADLHAEETIEEETPLMSAVRMRNQAVIRKLRELGASTEHVNKHGKNALLLAVRLGDQSVLDALLDNNVGNCPDVNAGGGTQPTALHEAARRGKKDMVESLISKHNARISEQGGRFNTALSAAAAKGWPEVVYYLIDNWGEAAGVNLPGGNFANSLGAALSSREFQLLPHLLRAKADVNAIDAQGRSSFHIAAALGSWDVILKLRKAEGAKPPKTDKQGRTLLHHAAVNRDAEVFQNLLRDEELASSINSRDVDGWMPIHWACKENNADVIRLICDQGNSAITETTTNGWTPENIAIICRADDAVDFIKNLRQKSGGQDKDDSNGGEVSEEALDPTGKQLQPGRHWVVGAQHGGITCDGCFMNVSLYFVARPTLYAFFFFFFFFFFF